MTRKRVSYLKLFGKAALLWQSKNAPRLGAALAFYTVLSLAPLLIVAVGVTSLFLSRAEVQTGLIEQLRAALGPENDQIVRFVQGLFSTVFSAYQQSTGIIATAVGSVVLLFGASLVVVELRAATNLIWGAKVPETRREGALTFIKNRLVSIGLVLGMGVLIVGWITASAYLNASSEFLREHNVSLTLVWWLEKGVGFLILSLSLALLYKYLPSGRVRWRDVWLASLFTALLFLVARWGIGVYVSRSLLGSAYGASGSLAVFLFWVYYTAQLYFYGVALCRAHRDMRERRRVIVQELAAQASAKPAQS